MLSRFGQHISDIEFPFKEIYIGEHVYELECITIKNDHLVFRGKSYLVDFILTDSLLIAFHIYTKLSGHFKDSKYNREIYLNGALYKLGEFIVIRKLRASTYSQLESYTRAHYKCVELKLKTFYDAYVKYHLKLKNVYPEETVDIVDSK